MEEEYWRIFHLIRGDVESAIKSNHAYLTIDKLVATDRIIYDKINRFPDFWTLNSFALQTTFFIAFGRLFDTRTDSHSIQKLIESTITNWAFFSKTALHRRKRQACNISGADPQWILEYISNAWEPTTAADLEPLQAALTPHFDKFKAIYKPIRHKVYAHKSTEDDAAISALFAKTVIADVNEILRFLHTLLWIITDLAFNGTQPDVSNFTDYEVYVKNLNCRTEKFIRQLP